MTNFISKELKTCRDQAWKGKIATRRHELKRVYINDAEKVDLIVVGCMTASTHDREELAHDFVVRISIWVEEDQRKINRYQVLVSGAKIC